MALDTERTEFWRATLHRVQRERLGREARANIVTNNLQPAAQQSLELLSAATDARDQLNAALFLGRALGSIQRDLKRGEAVIAALDKSGKFDASVIEELRQRFEEAGAERKQSFEEGNQAWLREQNGAIRALLEFLPGPRDAGEPSEGDLLKFQGEIEAMLKAAWKPQRPRDLIDAIVILSDYCPCDPSPVRSLISAEERMFLHLGPKARLVAVRALVKFGEQPALRQALAALTDSGKLAPEEARCFASFMGGLRHAEFLPFIKKEFEKAVGDREEGWFSEPLSRISHADGPGLLAARLEALAKKFGDPKFERRAARMIEDLGRALRINRELPDAARNELIARAIAALGQRNRELSAKAADDLFRGRLDTIEPRHKAWAVERLVDALWGGAPLMAGPARSGTENGWREPQVQALVRLGVENLPGMLAAADRHAAQYNGGMGSFARVMTQIGDARAVPVLERLATMALLHDPAAVPPSQRETFTDPVSGQVVPLDHDDLVHTILFALDKSGGEHGKAVVLGFGDRLQAGRMRAPGEKTASFLTDAKLAAGALDRVAVQREAVEMDEKTFKHALGDAKGGLLTKKAARIGGIALLGQARRREGVHVLVECLGDKDAMVAGAAHTALAEYLSPPPPQPEFVEFVDALFEHPKVIKGELLERLITFIEREVPVNAPYDKVYERQVSVAPVGEELRFRLLAANRKPEKPKPRVAEDGGEEDAAAASAYAGMSEADAAMKKKRDYLAARKAWAAGGKKTPEPKLPD